MFVSNNYMERTNHPEKKEGGGGGSESLTEVFRQKRDTDYIKE